MQNIFIKETEWNKFTQEEMKQYVNNVFCYYRKNGFPHFEYSLEKNIKKFKKLKEVGTSNMIENKTIKQTMRGLDIAWSYFPHVWEINYKNKPSPMQIFNNDDLFKKAIKKRIKLGDAMSDNMIRKVLCIFENAKRVSNFRPTAAKAIYEYFGGGIVYDMSAGFGGRLLGAMSTPTVTKYYGVDPSKKTYAGLKKMIGDLSDYFYGDAAVFMEGSENYIPPDEIDIAFTSPPYFDTEIYANEKTQSFIKYPTYDKWIDEFLRLTFTNVYKSLKKNGILAINISNTSEYPNLEKDMIRVAKSCGFALADQLNLILSQVSKKTGYKTEPIFIFNK